MSQKPRWVDIPQLMDREWLIAQICAKRSYKNIASELGISWKTVQRACHYHGIRHPVMVVRNDGLNKMFEKYNPK